jgi:predicted HicB family RNase H-like nuclease
MGIMDREKNRDNALKQIKSMISTETQITGQTDLDKDFPKVAPEKKESMIIKPVKEESRSKRVNFLIKPSVHKSALKKCERIDISLNECINQLLEAWIKE